MTIDAMHKYDDIINLSRPVSRHPKMSAEDRAKIFSPFAALKGYEEAVKAKEKIRVNKLELSDEEKELINQKLCLLKKGQTITLTYFHQDPGSDGSGGTAEGEYITLTGMVEKINGDSRVLRIQGLSVKFDDIAGLIRQATP